MSPLKHKMVKTVNTKHVEKQNEQNKEFFRPFDDDFKYYCHILQYVIHCNGITGT